MKRRGRPVLGAFSGFFAGLFLGLSLLLYGVIELESNLLVILPIAGLILVWAAAMWFPIGRGGAPKAAPAAAPAAPSSAATAGPSDMGDQGASTMEDEAPSTMEDEG